MKFSVGITNSFPLKKAKAIVRLAEAKDFHRLWVGEDFNAPDVFGYTYAVSRATGGLGVAIGITSPYVRHPIIIAAAAAFLNQELEGRFSLGLGVGGLKALEKMEIRPKKPVATLRETAEILRRLWSLEKVNWKGQFCLRNFRLELSKPVRIPLFFGVRGMKMLKMAAETGDGIIFSGPRPYLKDAVDIVQKVRSEKGRGRPFEYALWIPFIYGGDPQDLALAKRIVATMMADSPEIFLEKMGIGEEWGLKIRELKLKGKMDSAAGLITDTMLRDFSVYGDLEGIREQLMGLKNLGITEFIVGPPFGKEPERVLERLSRALNLREGEI